MIAPTPPHLSRRAALRAYAPPALAVVGLALRPGFGTSGKVRVASSDAGRGNGPEGNPDPDPGNAGGRNRGGDGVVGVPGAGNPHGGGAVERGPKGGPKK